MVHHYWSTEIDGTTMFKFNSKLRLLKSSTKELLAAQDNLKDQIEASKRELALISELLNSDLGNSELHVAKSKAKANLVKLQCMEEEDARQKSRENWLRHGDSTPHSSVP